MESKTGSSPDGRLVRFTDKDGTQYFLKEKEVPAAIINRGVLLRVEKQPLPKPAVKLATEKNPPIFPRTKENSSPVQ